MPSPSKGSSLNPSKTNKLVLNASIRGEKPKKESIGAVTSHSSTKGGKGQLGKKSTCSKNIRLDDTDDTSKKPTTFSSVFVTAVIFPAINPG